MLITILLLILFVPILNWIAMKRIGPKSKPKRFILWVTTTWILELGVLISALVIA